MNSIIKSLKDPSWWFTAVFISILASLVSSYLRDAISSAASQMSKELKTRRDARLARESRRVSLLVAHPDLLIMELIRATVLFIGFLGLDGISLSLPLFISASSKTPESSKDAFVSADTFHWIFSILFLAVGSMAMYCGFLATSRMRFVMRARSEFERSCR